MTMCGVRLEQHGRRLAVDNGASAYANRARGANLSGSMQQGRAQRFLSADSFVCGHFRSRRHRMTAGEHRAARANTFQLWREETGVRKEARTLLLTAACRSV
jgi:hypothetical protein